MMKEKYESLPLATLKDLAKARGLKGISTMKKAELIERMLEEDEKVKNNAKETVKELSANTGDKEVHDIDKLDSGITVRGILEVMQDGYGFIRSANYLPGDNDVYVSPSQIRRFNLKTGDILEGNTRIKTQQEKFSALLYLSKVNNIDPMKIMHRKNFEDIKKSQTCRASGIFHIIGTFFLCIHTADILHEERNTRKDLVNREPLIGRMRCMCQF